MQMQTEQRTVFSNHETRNETSPVGWVNLGGGSWFAGGGPFFQMRKGRRTNESKGVQHFSRECPAPLAPPQGWTKQMCLQILLKFDKEIELSCNSLGREFQSECVEMQEALIHSFYFYQLIQTVFATAANQISAETDRVCNCSKPNSYATSIARHQVP